jgi:hypothetical protein
MVLTDISTGVIIPTMKIAEIIKRLEADGCTWRESRVHTITSKIERNPVW